MNVIVLVTVMVAGYTSALARGALKSTLNFCIDYAVETRIIKIKMNRWMIATLHYQGSKLEGTIPFCKAKV